MTLTVARLAFWAWGNVLRNTCLAATSSDGSTVTKSASIVNAFALFHHPVVSQRPVVALYHCCNAMIADWAWEVLDSKSIGICKSTLEERARTKRSEWKK